MKVLILMLTLTLMTSHAYAIGPLEKGILIGVFSIPVIQHIFAHPETREEHHHYYHEHAHRYERGRHYRYRDPYPRQDCIWVTRYDRYTNEPAGYDRYCR